jgi:hypothetical protein
MKSKLSVIEAYVQKHPVDKHEYEIVALHRTPQVTMQTEENVSECAVHLQTAMGWSQYSL